VAPSAPEGLLVVDKPAGWTSHDVVARARRLCATRRVGHAGTLDPMATGVLVLGVGRATKLLTHLVGADKEYLATIVLGASTVTDDAEGEVVAEAALEAVAALTPQRLADAVAALTGEIQQVPSAVSAIKVDGRRAYARVRAGEDVVLAARPATVTAFEVLAVRPGTRRWEVDAAVAVSSGTYVRALARDAGAALGVGGHLAALRRTRVGPYGLDRAHTLDQLEADGAPGHLLGLADAAAAAFAVWRPDAEQARRLGHGQRLAPLGLAPGVTAAVDPGGDLVALVEERDGAVRPVLVLGGPPG
jgi:tRNA pseudouridine55 synthase